MSETDGATEVDADALAARIAAGEGTSVLDVRDRDEFEAWRIEGPGVDAVQVPYIDVVGAKVRDEVPDLVAESGLSEPVVAVCARGEASAEVAAILRENGVEAVNLADGMEGWARVLTSAEIPGTAATMRQYHRPSSGCLSYLVVSGNEAAVVDPLRAFADRYAADAADLGAEIVYAVDTHVHADHVSGVRAVAERTGATPVLPEGATDRGLAFDAHTLADGDELAVGDATLSALHVPGHTSEMTALRLDDLLLAGDSLFLRSVARPDLEREEPRSSEGSSGVERSSTTHSSGQSPREDDVSPRDGGDEAAERAARRLYGSLHGRILALPADTRVAPAHVAPDAEPEGCGAYLATVGDLRERIDVLALDEAEFVDAILSDMPPRPANYGEIIDVNLGRADAGDDEAFELELGPNNCAVS